MPVWWSLCGVIVVAVFWRDASRVVVVLLLMWCGMALLLMWYGAAVVYCYGMVLLLGSFVCFHGCL